MLDIMALYYTFHLIAQLLGHIGMEIIVWWEDPTTGRVMWRCLCLKHG